MSEFLSLKEAVRRMVHPGDRVALEQLRDLNGRTQRAHGTPAVE
jgi:hypothetical protein